MRNSLDHIICPNCKSPDYNLTDPEAAKLIDFKCNVCGTKWVEDEQNDI